MSAVEEEITIRTTRESVPEQERTSVLRRRRILGPPLPRPVPLHPGRNETEVERADRNFGELLQEIRVAQTGVQLLFAFLLALPFTARWAEVTVFQRHTYLATLLLSAAAAALLMAPVSHHRMLFRRSLKPQIVETSHTTAQGGMVLLLLAMAGAVLLLCDVVVGRPAAYWYTGGVVVWFLVVWYLIPIRTRIRHHGE